MSQFGVFSLADVMGKADQARAMRQQEQMNEMKMQEYLRNQQEQQTLGDIMSRSITTTGGSPAIAAQPEQVMPEDILGPPRPEVAGVAAVPGRTDFDYNKMFEQVPRLPQAMQGPVLQKLHAARATEEDRRLAMQLKMMQASEGKMRGVSDNDLAIVASGGTSGNVTADRLGREGAVAALTKKPLLIGEGVRVGDKSMAGSGIQNTKTIPDITSNKLMSMSSAVEDNEFLVKNFNPRFAGHQVTGEWQRRIDEMFKNDVEAATFWGAQARQQNKERHELFGAALTPTEFREWKNQAIHPGMTADVMKARLSNQNATLSKAARRLSSGLRSEGKFSEEAILQYLGGRKDLMQSFESTTGPTLAPTSKGVKFLGFE